MTFDVETLQKQIPYYLSADPARKALVDELKALSGGAIKGYFIPKISDPYSATLLQGDGWSGFQVFSFSTANRNIIQGIVLSNSCDVSLENERVLPANITFAPIVKLSKLQERFEERGLEKVKIDSRLQAIRSQTITNIFYLPDDSPLEDEYVVLLDDLHSMPAGVHQEKGKKIFTLSMAGFYLFIFKLSIHFCRLHENVDRNSRAPTAGNG